MFPIRHRQPIFRHPLQRKLPGVWAFTFGFSLAILFAACSTPKPVIAPVFVGDSTIGSLQIISSFGQFKNATAISVDDFGDVYIVDVNAPGVYKYSSKGDSLRAAVGIGSRHGEFDHPADIDATLTNSIAIADRNNNRIEIYSRDLVWQASIEGHRNDAEIRFSSPTTVRAASSGYFYIIDNEHRRLIAVNPARGSQQVIPSTNQTSGSELQPMAVAIDGSEYIAVSNATDSTVLVYNNTYTLIRQAMIPDITTARISRTEDNLIICSPNSTTIRLFNFHDLTYQGSLVIPPEIRGVVSSLRRLNVFYILTKEKVFVCTTNLK